MSSAFLFLQLSPAFDLRYTTFPWAKLEEKETSSLGSRRHIGMLQISSALFPIWEGSLGAGSFLLTMPHCGGVRERVNKNIRKLWKWPCLDWAFVQLLYQCLFSGSPIKLFPCRNEGLELPSLQPCSHFLCTWYVTQSPCKNQMYRVMNYFKAVRLNNPMQETEHDHHSRTTLLTHL